jgi:hypothetical protein
MSQRLSTTFVNTNIPGTYVNYTVSNQPTGVSSSGIVVLMGEADGGPSYEQTSLTNSLYTPDQLDQVKQLFTSGQLVDGFQAICAASNDPNITGTANQIYVWKTNTGTKASAVLAPTYGTLSHLNWGVLGNQDQYQILTVDAEVAPTVQGTTIPAFGAALNGDTFMIRLNGGAATTITLSSVPADHADVPTLVVELNAQLPSGITASAGTAMNSIALTVAVDSAAWSKGWGKSFELVDSTPGDLAALGLVAAMTTSSQEPGIEMQDSNISLGVSETLTANASIALMIGYQGTTATLTIASGMLTTTVTGGSGANLTINLSQYTTIGTLAGFIASHAGYSCTSVPAANQLPTSALDTVAAIGICSTASGDEPGRIKDSAYNFQTVMSTSRLMSFAPTATAGLPTPMALPGFLAGGTRGATLASDIVNAVDELGAIECNFIVPLISQDATADIAAGQTDPASTYTIAALNALLKSHCLEESNPSLNRNRSCILSYNGTFANAAIQAQSLASFRCSVCFQQVTQVNSQGVITTFQPWYASVVAAGMQTGGFYKAIVNKYANLISVVDPTGYNSGDPGDTSEALNDGLLPLYTDVGGVKWVSDQTTYTFDSNFVYNSIQAVYAADLIAINLKQSFTNAFVGQSLADVSAASASAFLTQQMGIYLQLKLIAPSNGVPLGFNGAKITIVAPTMTVAVNCYLDSALYFIPISFSISAVQQSA